MKHLMLCGAMALGFLVSSANAQENAASTGSEVITCKSGKAVRTLTKSKPAAGGCLVMYNKGDSDSKVAEAKNETTYCDKIMERIKGKLAGSGFICE